MAGCTHTTYYKTLKHALGINAVQWSTFQSTIKRMFPVVQEMVDRMCEEAKTEMKTMNQDELGSWSRAVTSADGTWMTRGFHSKNLHSVFVTTTLELSFIESIFASKAEII